MVFIVLSRQHERQARAFGDYKKENRFSSKRENADKEAPQKRQGTQTEQKTDRQQEQAPESKKGGPRQQVKSEGGRGRQHQAKPERDGTKPAGRKEERE